MSDQALAAARDAAAHPALAPIAITAANGEQCSWCDCPDGPDSPHNTANYQCSGCPKAAEAIVSAFAGPNRRYDYAACRRHRDDIVAALIDVIAKRPA
nr:hypothetical protein [Streptomyces sp. SID8352]